MTKRTPVQPDEDDSRKCAPVIPLQRPVKSPALLVRGHFAEDRLARRSDPEEELVS